MKIIGITGGVGSGKTELLHYLEKNYKCRILLADRAALLLQEPGGVCHKQVVALLGREILLADGSIDRAAMAARIFRDRALLEAVNAIVHPAVKEYILLQIRQEAQKKEAGFFFLEAALLIEEGYGQIVDEMWYVYADADVRRKRLKEGRQYTDSKIDSILQAQLSDETYRAHCNFVIDNSRDITYAYEQIDKKMGEYLWKK